MNLFSQDERNAVEDNWGHTPLYDMAHEVCNSCLESCRTFRLHPAELLYQCLYIIDTVKHTPRPRAERWVSGQYSELDAYLRHDKQTGASDCDIAANVALILHTTAWWLIDARGWIWAARLIERQIAERCGGNTIAGMVHGFGWYQNDHTGRREFMKAYMDGTDAISHDIDDMLAALDRQLERVQAGTTSIYNYNVNGDYVQNKNVQNEVNEVQCGAIGINTANG